MEEESDIVYIVKETKSGKYTWNSDDAHVWYQVWPTRGMTPIGAALTPQRALEVIDMHQYCNHYYPE